MILEIAMDIQLQWQLYIVYYGLKFTIDEIFAEYE